MEAGIQNIASLPSFYHLFSSVGLSGSGHSMYYVTAHHILTQTLNSDLELKKYQSKSSKIKVRILIK